MGRDAGTGAWLQGCLEAVAGQAVIHVEYVSRGKAPPALGLYIPGQASHPYGCQRCCGKPFFPISSQ